MVFEISVILYRFIHLTSYPYDENIFDKLYFVSWKKAAFLYFIILKNLYDFYEKKKKNVNILK